MTYLAWKEVPQSLQARITHAQLNTSLEPNCFGTAFFLLGVLPYDLVIYTGKGNVAKALKEMVLLDTPQNNCLAIASINKGIVHATYIESVLPFKGYQRKGAEGEFSHISSLTQIDEYIRSVPEWSDKRQTLSHSFYTLKDNDRLDSWAKDIVAQYHLGWDG